MVNNTHPLAAAEELPLDAPPPYDSLIFEKPEPGTENLTLAMFDSPGPPPPVVENTNGASPAGPSSTFDIAVVDPVKQGEGVGAYVSYKVVSTVSGEEGYRSGQHEVIRRFRDFTWLRNRLRSQHRGVIVPALPEKSVVEKYKMSAEFVEQRRAALGVFLSRVAAHPVLKHGPDLRLFLQADETGFAIEASRTAAEAGEPAPAASAGAAGAARKTLSTAARLIRSLGHSAAGLGSGAGPREEEESAEYLRTRAYISELEGLLAEAHRQSERLVRHHGALAAAVGEFGAAMAALGRHQEEEAALSPGAPAVARSLASLGEQAASVSAASRQSAEELSRSFEAPMRDFMRSVKAAKKAMADRSAALTERQAARSEVDAKRSRLTRLRATPGMKEERVMEAERDLQAAMARADSATQSYADITRRMDADLVRFQKERAKEMGRVLTEFAAMEAKASADVARLWRAGATEVGA